MFQDPASPVMGTLEFHCDLMFLLVFTVFLVLYMIGAIVNFFSNNHNYSSFRHNAVLGLA